MNQAVLLWATLAALLCAPLLYAAARHRPPLLAFMDGFVLVGIAGLVALEVVPGAFGEGGAWSAGFLLLGALGPSVLEHWLRNARREAHVAALALAVVGLILHSLADGAALAPVNGEAHEPLALAIVLHSIPVGLAVWWLMYPVFGALLPALALAAMCLGTLAGYIFGIELNAIVGGRAWAWFQALVAGSILHVVFGRPHLDDAATQRHAPPPYEGLGNLTALAGLVVMGHTHAEHSAHGGFADRWFDLALQIAPALLIAYLAAAAISAWASRHRPPIGGGFGVGPTLRGAARGLWDDAPQTGSSSGAAFAGAITSALFGLVTLSLSIALLGAEWTLIRAAAALIIATAVTLLMRGVLQQRVFRFVTAAPHACGPAHAPLPADQTGRADGAGQALHRSLLANLLAQVDRSAAWMLTGIAVAAALAPALAGLDWSRAPASLQVIGFALLGLPFYLSAPALTPVAAALLAAGASPGAVLALMLTGAATGGELSRRLRETRGASTSLRYAAITAAGAVLLGLLVNLSLPAALTARPTPAGPLQFACLLALALLYAASLLRRGGRALISDVTGAVPHSH